MIKATIKRYRGHVSGFTITGHADAGEIWTRYCLFCRFSIKHYDS